MKCENCGSEIEENVKFCSNCGAEIKAEVKEDIKEEKQVPVVQTTVKQAEIVQEEKTGFSIASLILGIVAILCIFEHGALNFICGILAIIFGIIGRKQGAKGIGTTGMILGIASLVLLVIVIIFLMIFASAVFFGLALS